MVLEDSYIARTSLTHRKKFGQFFTPQVIVDFMRGWVFEKKEIGSLLEPAFGLGIFSRNLNCDNLKITGFEIDRNIFSEAKNNISDKISLINDDYLTRSKEKYDFILCNPPYLKFHDYDNKKYVKSINAELNCDLNLFTNIYVLFLLKSINQLNEGGRLAYIIPSEFLNSDYGVKVKEYLLKLDVALHFIIIDFKHLSFDDANTTSCILLCEKVKDPKVRLSYIDDIKKLSFSYLKCNEFLKSDLAPQHKWKRYYEKKTSTRYTNLVPFSTFAKVKRGIATGSNDYFTFNKTKQAEFHMPDEALKICICRSADIKYSIFDNNDFERLKNRDKRVFLFNGKANPANVFIKTYIEVGEEKGIDRKYLTSQRSPWYALEKRDVAPIWVSVFNRNSLKFIRNKTEALNLTTFHCIYPVSLFVDADILYSYLITDFAKEILLNNSREYGSGLIKFEPNDLNKGLIVDLSILSSEENLMIKSIYKRMESDKENISKYQNELDSFFRFKYIIN